MRAGQLSLPQPMAGTPRQAALVEPPPPHLELSLRPETHVLIYRVVVRRTVLSRSVGANHDVATSRGSGRRRVPPAPQLVPRSSRGRSGVPEFGHGEPNWRRSVRKRLRRNVLAMSPPHPGDSKNFRGEPCSLHSTRGRGASTAPRPLAHGRPAPSAHPTYRESNGALSKHCPQRSEGHAASSDQGPPSTSIRDRPRRRPAVRRR